MLLHAWQPNQALSTLVHFRLKNAYISMRYVSVHTSTKTLSVSGGLECGSKMKTLSFCSCENGIKTVFEVSENEAE